MHSETCLKQNLGITEPCLWRKIYIVPRIWRTEDPDFKQLYKTEPACKGKKIWPLAVP
jgi:hypothetical protein